jgi:hypothetical protein
MSNLATPQVLDPAVIDREVSEALYAYDAAVRDEFADDPVPACPGTLEHHTHLTEFVD